MCERTKGMIEVAANSLWVRGADKVPPALFTKWTHTDAANLRVGAHQVGSRAMANLERLVAAWNACEGYDGPLFDGMLARLVKVTRSCMERFDRDVYAEEIAEIERIFSGEPGALAPEFPFVAASVDFETTIQPHGDVAVAVKVWGCMVHKSPEASECFWRIEDANGRRYDWWALSEDDQARLSELATL